jgi:CelD/BcsL family acetyltransferase involved in cellulose biosynthesis
MLTAAVTTRLIQGFDDPTFGPDEWERLLRAGNPGDIYLTWHFQRAWWETLGEGTLLLTAAEREGEIVALAPLYTSCGMVYFLGSAFESDYLDFVGDISDPTVLDALLLAARERVPDFIGFYFYFVPDSSGTGERLTEAGRRLGFSCHEKHGGVAPVLDLAGQPETALAAANKQKLLKLERAYLREGALEVEHLRDGEAILPYLDEFFAQHIARWAGTSTPSRFEDEKVRRLIERFTKLAAHTTWLRFTRIQWQARTIAFHYGYCYHGRYFWGMPSFVPDLAHRSPGQLLIRRLLLAAIEEGAHTFDFGTGDQPFKLRFASHLNGVRAWRLYPRSSSAAPVGKMGGSD